MELTHIIIFKFKNRTYSKKVLTRSANVALRMVRSEHRGAELVEFLAYSAWKSRKNKVVSKPKVAEDEYCDWKVYYRTNTDHDCCKVWTTARSAREAEDNVRREYWDIGEILSVIRFN